MKRTFLFISIIILSFLSAGFTVPDRLTIVELNTETLTVGNRELKVGGSFSSDQTIYWKSPKQAAEVQDNTGQLYIFTKEAFEQRNVKTPKEYLMSGKFSTRPAYDSPKTGRNKSSFPEKRVAMVIGNSNYVSKADFLRAPIADAGMISEKLVDLGFDTYTICDASSSDLFRAVDKFSEVASRYDIALFYYAGHGFCYNHENYCQPADVADIDAATIHQCLKASELMGELSGTSSSGMIVVLDACRNVTKVRGEEELAFIEAPSGMMILCSTSSGDRAVDAIGRNSPFAKAFADNISVQGLPISEVTRHIRNDVRSATSQLQTPSCSDNLYCNFIFVPGTGTVSQAITPVTPSAPKKIAEPEKEESVQYVDLGLRVKWATCNLGASSPEEYGDYYAWGEIQPKSRYYWDTYAWYNTKTSSPTKYKTANENILSKEDDAAYATLGQDWHIPTDYEWTELREKCDWQWTRMNGINGYKITGRKSGYTDKWIFLPAAGHHEVYLNEVGNSGQYWSSLLDSGYVNMSYCVCFQSFIFGRSEQLRCYGLSIRPVKGLE